MKSVMEQGFFHKFTFDNKALRTFVEFRICLKRSKFEFELSHIPNQDHGLDDYKTIRLATRHVKYMHTLSF